MKLEDYKNLVYENMDDVLRILDSKSNDYANSDETLLNFKQMHELCKVLDIRPAERLQDCGWFYVLMKLQRILNLREKDAANETVSDTITDLINYTMLSRACAIDTPTVSPMRAGSRVYVAGPYGRRLGADATTLAKNTNMALQAGIELIAAGYAPFIPHLYHFVHLGMYEPIDEDRWLEICLTWIPGCDLLVRLPGESMGADREVEEAKRLGIPIHTLDELC